MMKLARVLGVVIVGACVGGAHGMEDPPAAANPATTMPAATQPTTRASTAAVTPEARRLLDEVTGAYAKLKSLELTGTVAVRVQVEGEAAESHSTTFTATFLAPNRFRHESKDDVLVGGTGTKLYTYRADKNAYTLADAPKERVATSELPHDLASVVGAQNPSLMLALGKSASDELLEEVSSAAKGEDTRVGDVACPTLKLTLNDKTTMWAAFDPETHLLRQAKTDLTEALRKRRPDLVSAVVTTDYSRVKADGEAAKQEPFAWSPPAGAADADAGAAARTLDSTVASELEGKMAPGFKLPDMEGKVVSLADFKGQVVVLDFWATWCGPCKMALPHLDKMYQAQKDQGVQVFAVDQQEDQSDVAAFVKETKLGVPVLLDRDAKVGDAYGVEGIPQTVVIGRDGKVKKVFVGFDPDQTPGELLKAVEAAKK